MRIINNQYLLLDEISTGKTTVLYRAWDTMLQKFVAIKKINNDYFGKDTEFLETYRQKAVDTAKLEHKNILRVINVIKDDKNNLYLVMEYMKGVTLRYLMEKCRNNSTRMPFDIALFIISEVSKALDYAHNVKDDISDKPMDMIHAEMSPDNVMVYFKGDVKISGFSITAAAQKRNETASGKEEIREKIYYMSPEQIEGGGHIDARSDIFGTGAVLYEMLTGEKTFQGDTDLDVWQNVLNVNIDINKLKERNIPAEIRKVLENILQKSPEKRYQTAAEMFLDIKRYLSKKGSSEDLSVRFANYMQDMMSAEIDVLKQRMDKESEKDFSKLAREAAQMQEEPAKEAGPERTEKEEKKEAGAPEKEKGPEIREEVPEKYEKPTDSVIELIKQEKTKGSADFIVRPVITGKSAGKPKASVKPGKNEEIYKPPPITTESIRESFPLEEAKFSDDKEKTVFDFVLDTAKKYKRVFISVIIAGIIAFINFTILDTYMQFTPWGVKIHNIIWPPALKIDTIPSGAHIQIIKNDVDIIDKEGYKSLTPAYISNIQPGLYTLKLIKEGYGEMVRKITVFGKQQEDQAISIGGAKLFNGVYVVPFEIELKITSTPEGAELFIDGKKLGETPFKGSLEIGTHNMSLHKKGFQILGKSDIEIGFNPNEVKHTLGICMLDTSKTIEQQTAIDYRFWHIKELKTQTGGKKFDINGTLWKQFDLSSKPAKALVFVNDAPDSMGFTPLEGLVLPAGVHNLRIESEGYLPWKGTVEVEADTDNTIEAVLSKIVTVYSFEAGKSSSRDIGAKISIIGMDEAGETPFTVTLAHGKYTFKLTKGLEYEPATVTHDIGDIDNNIKIKMQLRPPYITAAVTDYKTGKAVGDATIWVNGAYWRRTDRNGKAADYIYKASGEIDIEVKADKYNDFRTVAKVWKGQRKTIDITLGVPNDGKIIINLPNEFLGASIYLDGEYVGEDSQVISGVPRSHHDVEFKFNNINKDIVEKVEISKAQKVIILTPVQQGTKITIEREIPPYMKVVLSDYVSGKSIPGASVSVNGELWKKSDDQGIAAEYIEKHTGGELSIEIKTEEYEDFKTVAVINPGEKKDIILRLGAPRDGTVVVDIPESVYDAAVYLDGKYLGERLGLITEVQRGRHVLEVKSGLFIDTVMKVIELEKADQLLMLSVVKKDTRYYIEEMNPEFYLKKK
ncbi:MAG: serine/threonine-protein kinase [Elusimicrobiota bacterium]